MQILIVGAGNVGRALGRGWTRSGHKVTYAVRDPSKPDLEELRRQGASVISSSGAAAAAEVIALTVPWPAVDSGLKALGTLAGKIVIDATNPLTPDFSLAVGHTDSAGETVARLAPGARVVKVKPPGSTTWPTVAMPEASSSCWWPETTLRPRRSC